MNVWPKCICILFTLALLTAAVVAQQKPDDFEISLQRTSCFGTCPVYKVTIRSDGTVTYDGQKFVRVTGTQTTNVPQAEVRKLANEILEAGFFSFDDSYRTIKHPDGTETMVTDLPTTFVSLRVGSKTKTVEDYVGAPKSLDVLEARIDELAGTRKWVFMDGATVRELVQHGLNPKSKQAEQHLIEACEYGYEDVVRELLAVGVSPNTPSSSITPLQIVRAGSIVKLLVQAGADVNAVPKWEYGTTPLQQAARYGSSEAVFALIDAGAKFNYADKYGETILMYAVYSGIAEKVRILLKAGADVNAQTKDGKTALTRAQELLAQFESEHYPDPLGSDPKEYSEIINVLKAAGAK